MIRHICMFKIKNDNKEEDLAKVMKLAEELLKPIDLLKHFEVVLNAAGTPEFNYDFSLIFDFSSIEDLNAYQQHPNHIQFGSFLKTIKEERACIDYEL